MDKQRNNIDTIRHSCSHLLAAAVLELWPGTKFSIGPSIENGFYYDFEFTSPISESDLPKIKNKMEEIKKKGFSFTKKDISFNEAKDFFKKQPYKIELIKDLTKSGGVYLSHSTSVQLSIYEMGGFIDLCRGPHVESTKEIGFFKLMSIAGAYWRGSEKNKMLTRIYGTCFPTKKELDDYLNLLKEAKKRDHRMLGKELDLFSVDDSVGPGLVLWHPKLSIVREEIESYWRKQHRKHGYQYVYTPHVGTDNLWKTSGHLEFFKDGMYPPMAMENKSRDEKSTYYVKPMNCPFHVRIFKSQTRSYRDLPFRWCELGTVYRYEESGVLHGMLRVRGFTQDDAHIICREDQFVQEVNQILDFGLELNKDFGFDKLKVYLSTRDMENKTKYVGEKRIWVLAEKTLKDILQKRKIKYQEDIGGAKFYGPSIDLKAVDSLEREWQGTTIQLDMNLPSKFEMTYIGEDGKQHIPVMLHRTLLGSMERFVATLIEQYAGAFPVWLAPVQIRVIPISEKTLDYSERIVKLLSAHDIRAELDKSNETLNYKIRSAETQKIPYMAIVGQKEVESNNLSVRVRGEKDLGKMSLAELSDRITDDIANKRQI